VSYFPAGYFGPITFTGGGGSPLPPPPTDVWADIYATDEDVAIVALGDFPQLIEGYRSYTIAYGVDGAMASGSWILTSASNNFTQQGVARGHLMRLDGLTTKPLGADQVMFAVESVTTTSCWIRPIGQQYGVGIPPSFASSISSIRFSCHTMMPILKEASRQVDERMAAYGDVNRFPEQYQRATICRVLCDLYRSKARQTRQDEQSEWKLKADAYCQEFESIIKAMQPGGSGNQGAARRPRAGILEIDPTDDQPLNFWER
jgi:hypothetical protein